ncbi:MAG: CinA family nicotinamide mononucleotide deamidase-related protein [Phycisphaerae bacterium]|nr:CinA family nicotinamide mononucleotide deamidase-related protein [Phycisphaerae bacterium]
MHSAAAILSIGDELAFGQKLDTNSQWLADRLTSLGISVREHVTVADDLSRHVETLERLAACFPLVISTGGLGPTADDLTRTALSRLMREELVEDRDALEHIRAMMEQRGRAMTDLQRSQALRPRSAVVLNNPNGTAPGMWGSVSVTGGPHERCDVFCLPGPPGEMKPMFERLVIPRLRPVAGRVVRTRALHCLGIGEGDLAKRLGALMSRERNPLVGTTASGGVVTIRIRYEGRSEPAEQAMGETIALARRAGDPFVFGEEDETIESSVLGLLRARRERLVVAESCTGGGLGELFSRTPGSSEVLVGGWITYSNEMKSAQLGVPEELIRRHGAVSEEVATAMARGALRAAESAGGAHHALAVTGIAGPGGGSDAKPTGTVFIARASAGDGAAGGSVEVRRFLISGSRADVRDRSTKLALMMLRFHLLGLDVPRVLWQMELDGRPFPVV